MAGTSDSLDPSKSSYSLASVFELISACLDAVGAKTVLEVGAFEGDLTRGPARLGRGGPAASVARNRPRAPRRGCWTCARRRPELELIRETSHEALAHLELPDAIIIDGDHNYYTLSEELRMIEERAAGRRRRRC